MPGQLAGHIAVLTPSPPIVTRLHGGSSELPPAVDVGDRRVDRRRRVVGQLDPNLDLALLGPSEVTGGMIL